MGSVRINLWFIFAQKQVLMARHILAIEPDGVN
jgi:hypothetical protein